MKRRSSFLAILTLLLAGTLVFPTDYADAKKTTKSKKSSSSKKKNKKHDSETTAVAEDN